MAHAAPKKLDDRLLPLLPRNDRPLALGLLVKGQLDAARCPARQHRLGRFIIAVAREAHGRRNGGSALHLLRC